VEEEERSSASDKDDIVEKSVEDERDEDERDEDVIVEKPVEERTIDEDIANVVSILFCNTALIG